MGSLHTNQENLRKIAGEGSQYKKAKGTETTQDIAVNKSSQKNMLVFLKKEKHNRIKVKINNLVQ